MYTTFPFTNRSGWNHWLCLWLVACHLLTCGCQSLSVGKKPFPWEKEKLPPAPENIVAVWTEAVHHQTGKPSERGFGGRLMFHDAEQKAIKVTGKVTIFVFDDQREDLDDPAPKYRFIFPADVLDKHYSQSNLGPSYSFWIPLAPVDSPTHPYSIVARFDGHQGETLVSSLTRKALTGRGPLPSATAKKQLSDESFSGQSVVPVSYEEEIDPATVESQGMKAETIELSPSFSQRLQQPLSTNVPSTMGGKGVSGSASRENSNLVSENAAGSDANSRQSHSEPQKSLAPSEPSLPPHELSLRRAPHRGEWLSGLPPTPRSGFRNERPKLEQSQSALAQRAEQWFQEEAESPVATEVR